ncbi:Ribosome LSU-associated GTP-binding protein HflX [Olavius algarvensis associated proteobacterium Delta 3]|nr:Ribosome LSU-associated GTP-binding protein HflX [Olavius algarvensis associated proteobacterium Delta 3]CAB5134824.1 Ribosome LSU-associated GTP-binding protein HflX [Olavius algarvensis associated proteobacterium Delta 3]
MQSVFYPQSVAVVGVSAKRDNLGQNIVLNLVNFGFDGVVYAVGPKGGSFATRRIYTSILDIPGHVDLAVILVPARFVPDVLEDCGQKGIRTAIIETAGFREYSENGKQIEDRVVAIAAKYGINFIGPNCIGVINMENGFCVPFPRLTPIIRDGDVSIISQSGGVGLSIINHMAEDGIGLNKFVSAGNMLNIDSEDLLEYLIEDTGTRIIFVYLESIRDGRRLMDAARRSPKPILIFKSNIGKLGRNIAASHTASLSSDDKVVDAAFRQCGITRVRDVTTLSDYMKTLRLPALKNKRLAIISRSGGHAIVAADACELTGFQLAEFPEAFIREIETHFRASVIKLTNPLDLGDLFDLDVYHRIVQETLPQDNVDGVVFLHTSVAQEHDETKRLIRRLEALCRQYNKPVAVYLSAISAEISDIRRDSDFPIFTRIVEMFRALKLNFEHSARVAQAEGNEIAPVLAGNHQKVKQFIKNAQRQNRDLLLDEAVDVLESYGISTMRSLTATTAEEARKAADTLGYPVAMKLISEHISHKSDVGGVQLNLRDGSAVLAAYREMASCVDRAYPECVVDGVLVQPMAVGGRELIVGGRQDRQFGPVVMVGLGGIFVEIFEQATIRIAPISKHEARAMIEELSGSQILFGARGQKRFDIDAIVDTLLRVSQLLMDFPEIKELDVNPLRIFHEGEGCLALDARILL